MFHFKSFLLTCKFTQGNKHYFRFKPYYFRNLKYMVCFLKDLVHTLALAAETVSSWL